jgi:lipopolysaccharide/colanic/teichoic acid biosynthesis glycosyltransferase
MLYTQERIGKDGKPFKIYKIETIRDGEVIRPRLRRWGLDEIPQVINIIKGEMRFFGPRPEVPEIHERMSDFCPIWNQRLRVKPGVVSLAGVAGGIRGQHRFDPEVKIEQAVLDNVMIDSGWKVKFAILKKLPATLRKGQYE